MTGTSTHVAPSADLLHGSGLLMCVWLASSDSEATYDITVPASMTAGTEVDESFSTSRSGYETLSSAGSTATRTATSSSTVLVSLTASVAVPGTVSVEEVLQGSSATADVTLETSSDTESGWLLVAFHAWDIGTGVPDPTGTGWVPLATHSHDGQIRAWCRRVTSDGAQSVTFAYPTDGSIVDNHAHLFVLSGDNIEIVTEHALRFVGEVSEWPARWDMSGQDVWVPLQAQGILRRLGQGDRPLMSPLRSATLAADSDGDLVAYWPMEDGTDASRFASALTGGSPMIWSGDAPDPGTFGPLLGSNKVAVLNATTKLSGRVSVFSASTIAVRCIMDVPSTPGWTDETPILHVRQSTTVATTTVATWEVRYLTGGALEVRALSEDGTELDASGSLAFTIHGTRFWLGFTVTSVGQNGDTSWSLYTRTVGDSGTVTEDSVSDQTFTGLVTTAATDLLVAPQGGLDELAVGHVMVSTDADFGDSYASEGAPTALTSFSGEDAATRADRLATEIGLTLTTVGSTSDAASMGAQPVPATFKETFGETYAADVALVYETRDSLGLSFRTRRDLYNQDPALELDYSEPGEVAPPLEPIEDDQNVANDVTVKRKDGSSTRSVQEDGALNVQDPPDGVGRYDVEIELNVQSDDQLLDQASWRRHLGTVDESRYPIVHVDLAALAAQDKWTLIANAAALDVGDRLTIDNVPDWLPPDKVDLLAIGLGEVLGVYDWDIGANTLPYSPWKVAVVSDTADSQDVPRVGSGTATLATAIDSDDTSLSVTTGDGGLWTTDSDDFPLDINVGGERIRLSGISGTSSPQTFTVASSGRSINDVSKSHASGTRVEVWEIAQVGL